MSDESQAGKVALAFAQALIAGQFDISRGMLSEALGSTTSVDSIREEFESMIEYGDGPVESIELMEVLDDWPAIEPGDVGWAYVAMNGDGYGEAVAVVVSDENGALVIREIEWGRP